MKGLTKTLALHSNRASTVVNTTAETDILVWGQGFKLRASQFTPPFQLRFRAGGFVDGTGTSNVTFRWKIGNNTWASVLLPVANQAGTAQWALETEAYVEALSGPTNAGCSGKVHWPGTYPAASLYAFGLWGVTADLTVDQEVKLTAQWDAAHASNEIICVNASLELLQP